ncbi:hypothetical protein B0A49_09774 [Cryomyces minteri]|uniref:MARVEL domain-containing protein n=1 Tax=Cryomyces minteri TaxID=331657 RepID=A0A4U0XBN1_9PEZI|nr:hypothetical protein B0A49_09774 [Cryomyces minteri]
MPRSTRRAVVVHRRYYWPDAQLNIWTIIMLATAGTILGISAQFMQIQNQMRVGVPWLFPYGITVGALTIIFIIVELILIAQRKLLPGVMMFASFILLVLFITGIIETAIQLSGPQGNVYGNCQTYVFNNKISGTSIDTLAWLQQNNICQCWQTIFAFYIVGAVFLVWMFIMAGQVSRDTYD